LTPRPEDGLTKVEFDPPRQETIRGTVGLGPVWHLAVSQQSGRILVSGGSKRRGNGECGTFEIDPATGDFRTLRVGVVPSCGGGGGPVSPDGKHVLTYSGKDLALLNMQTGAVEIMKGVGVGGWSGWTWLSGCTWSPDGRWIAAIRDGGVILIEAARPSHRIRRGGSGGGSVSWSPDSRLLLLSKSQLSCGLSLYFSSLEFLDVGTGRRTLIRSSHCQVAVPTVGWLVVQSGETAEGELPTPRSAMR
jgi:hypothetical protein